MTHGVPRRGWALLLALMMLLGLALAAVPGGAAFAATAGTTCAATASGTTCTTTDAGGNVLGTCTVSGATSCTPAVSGGSGVSGNLQALKTELTPNVGAVLTNPVTAPLVEGGMFILSMVILWFLFSALYQLAVKVHEQSKGGAVDHKSLHGALFAVGVLLLLVAGGATWLLVSVVQGLSSFLKVG